MIQIETNDVKEWNNLKTAMSIGLDNFGFVFCWMKYC